MADMRFRLAELRAQLDEQMRFQMARRRRPGGEGEYGPWSSLAALRRRSSLHRMGTFGVDVVGRMPSMSSIGSHPSMQRAGSSLSYARETMAPIGQRIGKALPKMRGSIAPSWQRRRGGMTLEEDPWQPSGAGHEPDLPWLTPPETALCQDELAEGESKGPKARFAEVVRRAAAFRKREQHDEEIAAQELLEKELQLAEFEDLLIATRVPRLLRERITEERDWFVPLVLDRHSFGRWFAGRLHGLVWQTQVGGLLMERMFDADGYDDDSSRLLGSDEPWRGYDDGFYRAPTSVHSLEPWNFERLSTQLMRSFQLGGIGIHAHDAIMANDCEILACATSTPGLTSERQIYLSTSTLRLRSQGFSKRRQLHASQLYDLHIDVSSISILRAPRSYDGDRDEFSVLDTEEVRAAAELLEFYHQYRYEVEMDRASQLERRLDALMQRSPALLQAVATEDAFQLSGSTDQTARREYIQHLEHRQQARRLRDEHEHKFTALCSSLYGSWKRLREIRQRQQFVCTPWRLQAKMEQQDVQADRQRFHRNVDAHAEELIWLHGSTGEQARARAESTWCGTKRRPGAPTYRFDVFKGEVLTSTDELKERVKNDDVHEGDVADEINRRQALRQVRVRLECRVDGVSRGFSPHFSVYWETLSTTPYSKVEGNFSPSGTQSTPPLHRFDLAVRTMPYKATLIVYITLRRSWAQLFPVEQLSPEIDVEIPSFDGQRVTHAAIFDKKLRFGSASAEDTAACEDGVENDDPYSGEVSVLVSWPGSVRSGSYVVPPPPSYAGPKQAQSSLLADGFANFSLAAFLHYLWPVAHFGPLFVTGGYARPPALKLEDRLHGFRFDPQDPESSALLDVPKPKLMPGFDVKYLCTDACQVGFKDSAVFCKSLRVNQLLQRAEQAGINAEALSIAGFEFEVLPGKSGKPDDNSIQPRGRKMQSLHQKEFVRRICSRIHKEPTTRTHVSYKNIVQEYGQETKQQTSSDLFEKLRIMLQPKRALRPSLGVGLQRKPISSAGNRLRICVSLAKVYNLPWRREPHVHAGDASLSLAGDAPSAASNVYGRSILGPWRDSPGPSLVATAGATDSRVAIAGSSDPSGGMGISDFPSASTAARVPPAEEAQSQAELDCAFGAPPSFLQAEALAMPQVLLVTSLADMQGKMTTRQTVRARPDSNPDVNQILEFQLCPTGNAEELTQAALAAFDGTLCIRIFDEVVLPGSDTLREVRVRRQRRYLGRFMLPWRVLHGHRCSLKGHFRAERPIVLFGYRAAGGGEPGGDGSLPTLCASKTGPEPLYVSLDVTGDPPLVPPEKAQVPIARGKETSIMLKHVQRWLAYFGPHEMRRVIALGTDMNGRSQVICRFLRPQKPPDFINPQGDPSESPFAIEAAARYVSLIPFCADTEMFPQLTDIWCTDQEFLNIQCGDWEEHATLLCNYFNYIDCYRRLKKPGYTTTDIQSYCMLCDILPEGEAMLVLRRDNQTGHCEFWNPVSGDCFFFPKRLGGAATLLKRLRPLRGGEDEEPDVLRVTPAMPVQKVILVFNGRNVWANLQMPSKHTGITSMCFDLSNKRHWRPLFATPREEALLQLPCVDVARASSSWQLPRGPVLKYDGSDADLLPPDPSHALKYEAVNFRGAAEWERRLEERLERLAIEHRAGAATPQITRWNRGIASRLGELLDDLESLCSCRRPSGHESVFPLSEARDPPAPLGAIEGKMREIEQDWLVGSRGKFVYGIPFNHPHTEDVHIWETLRDTGLLELGDESSEYAIRVRVFAYPSNVMSIWVFAACVYAS